MEFKKTSTHTINSAGDPERAKGAEIISNEFSVELISDFIDKPSRMLVIGNRFLLSA